MRAVSPPRRFAPDLAKSLCRESLARTASRAMTVAIVTDSAAALPSELVARHAITVVPMWLTIGADSVREGERPLSELLGDERVVVGLPHLLVRPREHRLELGERLLVELRDLRDVRPLEGPARVAQVSSDEDKRA